MNIEIIHMKEGKEKEKGGTKLVFSSKSVLKEISTPVLYLI
jgi:hypothetical protein